MARELSERISAGDYLAWQAKRAKPGKYRNQPTVVDGVRFQSKNEARRYGELRWLEREGCIRHLEYRKPYLRYRFEVNGVRIGRYYEADFAYEDVRTGMFVVEDVKSAVTRRLPKFRDNCDLMQACYGITVQVIEYT